MQPKGPTPPQEDPTDPQLDPSLSLGAAIAAALAKRQDWLARNAGTTLAKLTRSQKNRDQFGGR
jgi:hypothetical protein